MSVDFGGREFRSQLFEQIEHGLLLLGCASVLGCFVVFGKSTDVADADAVGVMSLAVCADEFERTAFVDCAVEVDDVVVAYLGEATLTMPAVDVSDGEGLAFGCGGAMDDYQIYFSHKSKRVMLKSKRVKMDCVS